MTHVNPLKGSRKVGSVGIPVPETDSKVVDLQDGRTEVPAGTEGELIIKGPQVMKGYWNRPDETSDMIRDGWLHTGDIAVADKDGYFFIVGRKKDMIVAGGYNIYPDEVDRVSHGPSSGVGSGDDRASRINSAVRRSSHSWYAGQAARQRLRS